jgi:hypothetical protein
MSNWLGTLFSDVEGWFKTPAAEAVEKKIAALLPAAMTIVGEINALAPNRTLTEINAIATKYVVPTVATISADPAAVGNTLLNLATTILAKNNAPAAATSLLNTVVQLAVVASNPTGAIATVPAKT